MASQIKFEQEDSYKSVKYGDWRLLLLLDAIEIFSWDGAITENK